MDLWRGCGARWVYGVNISDFPALCAVWRDELNVAEKAFSGLTKKIQVKVDSSAGLSGRAYGYFDPETNSVVLSPRLEVEPGERTRAIIRHELGHAVAFIFLPNDHNEMGQEAKADAIAQRIGGSPLKYDRWDVQTIGNGSNVRPSYLHR